MERRGSPFIIVVAVGMIAALLYPVFMQFEIARRSRGLIANGFGIVVAVMCGLAIFYVVRRVFFSK
jgi:hypothetical protein